MALRAVLARSHSCGNWSPCWKLCSVLKMKPLRRPTSATRAAALRLWLAVQVRQVNQRCCCPPVLFRVTTVLLLPLFCVSLDAGAADVLVSDAPIAESGLRALWLMARRTRFVCQPENARVVFFVDWAPPCSGKPDGEGGGACRPAIMFCSLLHVTLHGIVGHGDEESSVGCLEAALAAAELLASIVEARSCR